VQQIPIKSLKRLPDRLIALIVTFRPSANYNPDTYCNERVGNIVNLLVGVQEERIFGFLVQGILDLNVHVGNARSWLRDYWPRTAIRARRDLDQDGLKEVLRLLFELKQELSDQAVEEYLSVIVPKYVLRKLEWKFVENGMNDVYVHIEKQIAGMQYIWDSSQRQGSNSIDAAVWNNLNQEGACYECKLGTAIEQDQIDLLCCVRYKSDQRIEVGLASFASASSIQKRLLNLDVPSFVKIIDRNEMFRYWSL